MADGHRDPGHHASRRIHLPHAEPQEVLSAHTSNPRETRWFDAVRANELL
jgi:hypothetical protein